MMIEYENAEVGPVRIGTGAHDGRGFFSVQMLGESWGQGLSLRFTQADVDCFISVCGAGDLMSCTGCYVRVGREDGRGPILAVIPLINCEPRYEVRG